MTPEKADVLRKKHHMGPLLHAILDDLVELERRQSPWNILVERAWPTWQLDAWRAICDPLTRVCLKIIQIANPHKDEGLASELCQLSAEWRRRPGRWVSEEENDV